MGSSLDQIGPLAKTIEDARILFNAIVGYDPNDSTSLPSYISKPTGKRIGVPRKFLEAGIDPDVKKVFDETLEQLRANGSEIIDIEMPNLPYALPVYYIVCPAEVSTNLARYDGIRYGLSIPGETIQEVYAKTRGTGFGAEVRRRILTGTFVLSSGYSDAYYRKARAVRSLIRADFARAFESVDAVALPTAPNPAFKIGEKTNDPLAMYLEDIFSVTANLAGVPAISVPSGTVVRDSTNLPVGFQLIGPWQGEETLFTIGELIEKKR
jgi:aspartyl-tRNA(Asn)/glutamyl-tRNA(Gln) amidotransferase subunit A